MASLHQLLHNDVKWSWGRKEAATFSKVKERLQTPRVLVHYDSSRSLLQAVDASPYGIGAVLSHKLQDGSDRSIAFVSRSLIYAERKYSQLGKEALDIVVGVKHFHCNIYDRHFHIHSDHKPLAALFRPENGIPTMATARIQRWALTLSADEYELEFKLHGIELLLTSNDGH